MSEQRPINTFHAAIRSTASPAQVYEVLADVNTHLTWEGEQAPKQNFRLLTMEAPVGRAIVGTRFSSTGANSKDGSSTFTDHSVVVEATPDTAFAFETDASLSRVRRPTWLCHFSHRYALEADGSGTVIRYTCEVRPQNYVPYWLQPWFRPLLRASVQPLMRKHMSNLARIAERSVQPV